MSDYDKTLHAIQSAIAAKMAIDPSDTLPKHLRVGINSALCDSAALARLLIEKGVFTEQEYTEAIILELQLELGRYKRWFTDRGIEVDFA